MSDRFFYPAPLGPGEITLEGQEAHHLAAVRRFTVGNAVTLFNGDGHEYPATITSIEKRRVALRVTSIESPNRELGFKLHIASALPKGDRGDFLIEKLTELGATDFTPLITERTVVKATVTKAEKLTRAVIEASKQCGRSVLMCVHPPAKWLDWCIRQTGRRLIAHPSASASMTRVREDTIVAIGPEGGLTDIEMQTAVANGWEPLSLGPRILRVETAAVAVCAWIGLNSQT